MAIAMEWRGSVDAAGGRSSPRNAARLVRHSRGLLGCGIPLECCVMPPCVVLLAAEKGWAVLRAPAGLRIVRGVLH